MTKRWFMLWGWVYRPISWQGFVVFGFTVAFCIQVFLAIDSHSHSVTDTLYNVFPYIVCSLVVLYWIADKTSGKLSQDR